MVSVIVHYKIEKSDKEEIMRLVERKGIKSLSGFIRFYIRKLYTDKELLQEFVDFIDDYESDYTDDDTDMNIYYDNITHKMLQYLSEYTALRKNDLMRMLVKFILYKNNLL